MKNKIYETFKALIARRWFMFKDSFLQHAQPLQLMHYIKATKSVKVFCVALIVWFMNSIEIDIRTKFKMHDKFNV